MRSPMLAIAIAFVLALPCTALADKKKNNASSGGKQEYLQVQMKDVYISRVQPPAPKTNTHSPTTTGTGRMK
jgi:hypothetical protein